MLVLQYLNNLISCYSSCSPKIEYFPDEHGDLYELYGDKEIPGVKELIKTELIDEKCLELAEIGCHVCGVAIQSFTVQSTEAHGPQVCQGKGQSAKNSILHCSEPSKEEIGIRSFFSKVRLTALISQKCSHQNKH